MGGRCRRLGGEFRIQNWQFKIQKELPMRTGLGEQILGFLSRGTDIVEVFLKNPGILGLRNPVTAIAAQTWQSGGKSQEPHLVMAPSFWG
jgi:hypothetical protein